MSFLFSSPKVDKTVQNLMLKEAEEARKKEEARAAAIKTGLASINKQFTGFNDAFYKARQDAMLNYYQPQLNDQFNDAKKQLTYNFARAGTLKSTMAADRTAKLTKDYNLQKAGLVSQALADANSLRGNVQNQKSSLISQLNATGDAQQVANDATAATKSIFANRPSYSTLGDIFAGVAAGIGNMIGANQLASYRQAYFQPTSAGGSGSARTV